MKKVKKYIIVLLVIAMIAVFVSCNAEPNDQENGTPGVTTAASTTANTTAATTTANTTANTTAETTADVKKVIGFEISPPEGWTEAEVQGMWYAPGYPDDPSNMNIQTLDADAGFMELMSYTAESIKEVYETSFEAMLGEHVDVTVILCEKTSAAGFETMVMAIEYKLYGVELFAKQYAVKADELGIVITMTQAGGEDWIIEFDECVNNIVWTYEK